jgi:type III secretion protein S
MPQEMILQHAKSILTLVLILSLPILGIAAGVGFFVGLIQAVTQIQDNTLPQVLKLVSVLIALLLLGPWMAQPIIAEAEQVFSSLANARP